jgi:predicted dehydrogenase
LGLGVGEQHALAYAREPGCRLRWVYDLEANKMDQVVARIGTGRPAPSLAAILNDPEVDLVSIASYDDAHHGQIVASLEAGKHVFAEKPLCRTLAELRALRVAWTNSGRSLRSNLILQTAPVYQWLQDAVANGELGEVYAIDGDYLYGRLAKITEGWRKDVPDYSVMLGGGIHLVDLMFRIAGRRPHCVRAIGNQIASRGTDFKYHDYVAATFTFQSGLIARIAANFGCVHRHQHVLRVFGTRGTFIHDDRGARLHLEADGGAAAMPVALDALPTSKGELIPQFVASLISGADVAEQTEHDLDVVNACLSAEQAAVAGGKQRIEYIR